MNQPIATENTQESTHCILLGHVYLYREKAPWVKSGHSVQGGLEYDPKTDRVKCHECGQWFVTLAAHLGKVHKLSSRDYKIQHKINITSGLCGERHRSLLITRANRIGLHHRIDKDSIRRGIAKSIQTRRDRGFVPRQAEKRNEEARCPAQMASRIRQIADKLGRCPTMKELRDNGLHRASIEHSLGVTVQEALLMADLLPRKPGIRPSHPEYSKEFLVEVLRTFYVTRQRLPKLGQDDALGLVPRWKTFKKYFGSWPNALQEAGLGKVYRDEVKARVDIQLQVMNEAKKRTQLVA